MYRTDYNCIKIMEKQSGLDPQAYLCKIQTLLVQFLGTSRSGLPGNTATRALQARAP